MPHPIESDKSKEGLSQRAGSGHHRRRCHRPPPLITIRRLWPSSAAAALRLSESRRNCLKRRIFAFGSKMTSFSPVFSFSETPTITTAKLNWKNYLSWSASHDHLEKSVNAVPNDKKPEREKLDYQLCVVLWQSVEPDKKAQEIFANDIQSLFDATVKVTALKQSNHDMIAHMGKARATVEELRRFLVPDSLEEVNRKLDKFYMVLILRSLHSDFDHVRDQVLAKDQVPSMDSLITRLLCVAHALKDENLTEVVETSAMVAPRGRGGGRNSRGGRNGRSGRPQCTYCKRMGHTQENWSYQFWKKK
ncbi:hypothetical protein GmHk_17G048320 [Glycine max]|nr:hypothetical protein GmHk_17G048320 [Glycine max]